MDETKSPVFDAQGRAFTFSTQIVSFNLRLYCSHLTDDKLIPVRKAMRLFCNFELGILDIWFDEGNSRADWGLLKSVQFELIEFVFFEIFLSWPWKLALNFSDKTSNPHVNISQSKENQGSFSRIFCPLWCFGAVDRPTHL